MQYASVSVLAVGCVLAPLMLSGKGDAQPSQVNPIGPSVVAVYPVDTRDREKPAWVLFSDGGIRACQFTTLVASDTAIECGAPLRLTPPPQSIHPVPSPHRNKAAWVLDRGGGIRACEFTQDTLLKNAPACSPPQFGESP